MLPVLALLAFVDLFLLTSCCWNCVSLLVVGWLFYIGWGLRLVWVCVGFVGGFG